MTAKKRPVSDDEIIIPELEEAMKTYCPKHEWSSRDIAAVKKYYGKVPITQLSASLKRSISAIRKYAETHGIKHERNG
jgi:hypothetical protein